jgi:hypothetical protein
MRVLRLVGSAGLIQMMSHFGRCRARGWLAAGLLLAGYGWFSPSTSWAGCSHYLLTVTGPAQSRIDSLDPFVLAGALPTDTLRSSPRDGRPAPCSGWRCSRNSSSPIALPQIEPRIDACEYALLDAITLRLTSSPIPYDDDSSRPLDRVERLARPPR